MPMCRVSFSLLESDGEDWPVEQEEQMEVLLCDPPALLPTLTLSLAPEGHITEAPAPPAPKPNPQTATQGKTGKVIGRLESQHMQTDPHALTNTHTNVCTRVTSLSAVRLSRRRRLVRSRSNWSLMKWISSSTCLLKVRSDTHHIVLPHYS